MHLCRGGRDESEPSSLKTSQSRRRSYHSLKVCLLLSQTVSSSGASSPSCLLHFLSLPLHMQATSCFHARYLGVNGEGRRSKRGSVCINSRTYARTNKQTNYPSAVTCISPQSLAHRHDSNASPAIIFQGDLPALPAFVKRLRQPDRQVRQTVSMWWAAKAAMFSISAPHPPIPPPLQPPNRPSPANCVTSFMDGKNWKFHLGSILAELLPQEQQCYAGSVLIFLQASVT